MGYSPWGRKESDTCKATEHTHTLVPGHKAVDSAPSPFSSVAPRARSGGHGDRLPLEESYAHKGISSQCRRSCLKYMISGNELTAGAAARTTALHRTSQPCDVPSP